MLRIYLPNPLPEQNQITIPPDKVHYLRTVLRCKHGERLLIFDGKGNCYRTSISKVTNREIKAVMIETVPCDAESPLHIVLVQALLQGEKMDFVVQKTTELGACEVMPVVTAHSQVRTTRKTARWKKISEEAARQSGRSVVPTIHNVITFPEFFHHVRGAAGFLFATNNGMDISLAVKRLKQRFKQNPGEQNSLYLLVGPEGGFTEEETMMAHKKGFLLTSLGPRVLRAETAAISAVILLQFLLGDMN